LARVTVVLEVEPTATEPKATDAGLALSCAVPLDTAVPVSAIDKALACVSVDTTIEPFITPGAVGENLMFREIL
jgi:hypothetical protein